MALEAIDVFSHYLPPRFYDKVMEVTTAPVHMFSRARAIPAMSDSKVRVDLMSRFDGYRQIPCLVSPPIEYFAGPDKTPDLARVANEELALLTENNKEIFPGFVASLPMNNIDAALVEAERAVKTLGACGVQIFTNVNGRPIDEEEFFPLFELMSKMDRPIWIHPTRGMNIPDYQCEKASKYEIWWTLGWPYETSVAMYRLVLSGIFERWPDIRIITHHVGGMIPMMEGRLGPGMELYGTRTPEQQGEFIKTPVKSKPLDVFKRFFADTASFGSRSAIECGLKFFGKDKMVFGTDMPFDPEHGTGYIRETLKAINDMDIPLSDKENILSGNIKRILNIK